MRLRKTPRKEQPVERPVLQLPLMREPEMVPAPKKDKATEEENPRGIAVIDFYV
jgi:hypothetical protein